jgi:hypothetical protein
METGADHPLVVPVTPLAVGRAGERSPQYKGQRPLTLLGRGRGSAGEATRKNHEPPVDLGSLIRGGDWMRYLGRGGRGGGTNRLNRAAFSLGMLAAGGELDKDLIQDELLADALAVGLPEREARASIRADFGPAAENHAAGQPADHQRETLSANLSPSVRR